MLVNFDPVFFSLGPLKIHWYGLMYLLGFLAFWMLGNHRAKQLQYGWTQEQVGDFLFYGVLGVVIGGRLGYLLFYDFANVLEDPRRIYQIWNGGMSFHGGFLGILAAIFYYQRKTGKAFHEISDFIIPLIPPGLFFGRVGNFIGGELWGRISDVPWAMVFPAALPDEKLTAREIEALYETGQLDHLARHPSQLYEAFLEGIVLFVIVWIYSRRIRPPLAVTGLMIAGYGVFRSIVEWFREPDRDIGFLFGNWLTMGQLLSWPLIIAGVTMLAVAYRRSKVTA
ncbi:MAG: prolipoprotein diacylglyceryl transferase [Pseudomonadota bacterium]